MPNLVFSLLRLRHPLSLKNLIILLILTIIDIGISILANLDWREIPGRIILYFAVISAITMLYRGWRKAKVFPSEFFIIHSTAITYYALAVYLPLPIIISYINQAIGLIAMAIYWLILIKLRWPNRIKGYINSELGDNKGRVSTGFLLSIVLHYHSLMFFAFILLSIIQINFSYGYITRPSWIESIWHILIASHIVVGFNIPIEQINNLGRFFFSVISVIGLLLQAVIIVIFINIYEKIFNTET